MSEPELDVLMVLQNEGTRRVLEYLVVNLTASALKLSYALKMPPEDVEKVLAELEAQGLVSKTARQMPGAAYVLTAKGQQLRRYLSGPSVRQYKL